MRPPPAVGLRGSRGVRPPGSLDLLLLHAGAVVVTDAVRKDDVQAFELNVCQPLSVVGRVHRLHSALQDVVGDRSAGRDAWVPVVGKQLGAPARRVVGLRVDELLTLGCPARIMEPGRVCSEPPSLPGRPPSHLSRCYPATGPSAPTIRSNARGMERSEQEDPQCLQGTAG